MVLYAIGAFVFYKVIQTTTEWDGFICVSGCF
mgnify:FL=1